MRRLFELRRVVAWKSFLLLLSAVDDVVVMSSRDRLEVGTLVGQGTLDPISLAHMLLSPYIIVLHEIEDRIQSATPLSPGLRHLLADDPANFTSITDFSPEPPLTAQSRSSCLDTRTYGIVRIRQTP